MKRLFVVLLGVFFCLVPLSAQRNGLYLSGGLEGSGIIEERFMLGPVLHFEGRLFRYFSLGLKGVFSIVDLETIFAEEKHGYRTVGELLLTFRFYPFAPADAPENKSVKLEPFVEASSGMLINSVLYEDPYSDYNESFNAVEAGAALGLRLLLGPSTFLEPYFRVGLPIEEDSKLFFAGGISIGGRLGKAPPKKNTIASLPPPSQAQLARPDNTQTPAAKEDSTQPNVPQQNVFLPPESKPQEIPAQPVTPAQQAPTQQTPPASAATTQQTPAQPALQPALNPPAAQPAAQTAAQQTQTPPKAAQTQTPTQTTPSAPASTVQQKTVVEQDVFVIYFAPNTDVYDGKGVDDATRKKNVEALKAISKILKENPASRALIEGEANPVSGTNRERTTLAQLSSRRANRIAQFLKQDAGITDARLVVRSEGGNRTVVPRSDSSNWEQNRRVEVRILW